MNTTTANTARFIKRKGRARSVMSRARHMRRKGKQEANRRARKVARIRVLEL